jgi:predicted flap endonuclease-1-like 5' DNA nuclease
MFYLIQFHWVWLLLTVLFGSAIGWTTCTTQNEDRYRSWFSTAAVAFLVGLLAAMLRLLPGRLGYWLDMALLMFAVYIIGCCIGCWLKGRLDPDRAAVTPTSAKAGSELVADQRQTSARLSPGVQGAPSAPDATAAHIGQQPATLAAPINGVKDDLKLIRGVGPINENALNRLGIFHFGQIAQWKPDEATWVGHSLAFPGRIERERWIDQAQILNRGNDTVYSRQVKSGAVKPHDALLTDSAVASLRADLAMVPEAPTGPAQSASASVAPIETGSAAPPIEPTKSVPQTSSTAPSATSPAASSRNETAAALPAQTAPVEQDRFGAADHPTAGDVRPGSKPVGLAAPIGGIKDDLKRIKGIGLKNETALNNLGIFHFYQIADWTPDEASWTGHHMAFPGRIEREHWIDQAKILSHGGSTDYSRAVQSGSVTPADAPLSDAEVQAVKAALREPGAHVTSVQSPIDNAAVLPSPATSGDPALGEHPGSRPAGLTAPTGGVKDDLKRVKGIGPKNEAVLNTLGIFYFCQIADWTAHEALWTGHHMAFPGRIEREHWIDQAKILCAGGETEHSKAVQSGLVTPDDVPLSSLDVDQLMTTLAEPVAPPPAEHPGSKPPGLPAPTGGAKDDLKFIKGIGPRNEKTLNELGIFHFCQIADWTAAEALWTGHHMAFPGRIEREHWINQAKLLCAGVDTVHAKAVRQGAIAPDDAPLSAEEARRLALALPKQIESVAREEKHDGRRPLGLTQPRGGSADDLKRIKGIGPQNEVRLHALGIWHFDQIAAWSPDNIRWVGSYLAFPGRIDREQWVAQARLLASGADISKGVQRGAAKSTE